MVQIKPLQQLSYRSFLCMMHSKAAWDFLIHFCFHIFKMALLHALIYWVPPLQVLEEKLEIEIIITARKRNLFSALGGNIFAGERIRTTLHCFEKQSKHTYTKKAQISFSRPQNATENCGLQQSMLIWEQIPFLGCILP